MVFSRQGRPVDDVIADLADKRRNDVRWHDLYHVFEVVEGRVHDVDVRCYPNALANLNKMIRVNGDAGVDRRTRTNNQLPGRAGGQLDGNGSAPQDNEVPEGYRASVRDERSSDAAHAATLGVNGVQPQRRRCTGDDVLLRFPGSGGDRYTVVALPFRVHCLDHAQWNSLPT